MAGRWISPGTPVSSTNKTDRHDVTGILLKVPLNTIILTLINHAEPEIIFNFKGFTFTYYLTMINIITDNQ